MIPRSSSLLKSLIDSGEFTADDLARELVVTPPVLEGYIAGTTLMPLSRQLVLAKLVIAKSTKLKRLGSALHAQVVAATNFHAKKTATHSGPPPGWNDPRRRR